MDFPALSLSIHFFGRLYSAQIKLGCFCIRRSGLRSDPSCTVNLLRIKRLTCPRWFVYEYEVLGLFRKKSSELDNSMRGLPPPPPKDQISNLTKYLVQPTFLTVTRRMFCSLLTLKLLFRSVKTGLWALLLREWPVNI